MFYQYEELTEIPCCDNVFLKVGQGWSQNLNLPGKKS